MRKLHFSKKEIAEMKNRTGKIRLRIASLLSVLAFACVVSIAGAATAITHDDEAAVRQALLTSATSFEKNDLTTAMKVWANDESLIIFESGHANYGWPDYRDNHLVPEMGEMKNTKYGFSDIRIHLAGKTAWATFKYTIAADVLENGKQRHVDGSGLGTAILEKRAYGWRIVHWHSSAPRRAPTVAP
jgi:ketosteroid isomerase-like protein